MNTVSSTNPNYSSLPAAVMKINSASAQTRLLLEGITALSVRAGKLGCADKAAQ